MSDWTIGALVVCAGISTTMLVFIAGYLHEIHKSLRSLARKHGATDY